MARFVEDNDPSKADASPTKEFFVDIVTKDIQLDEAIQDLVDNCVDGAKRLRPNGDFRNLYVRLTVTEQEFIIEDNCGGIPLEIARKYAFKFGRAKGFGTTKRSVGQFGIGMKRAIFKLGARFEVYSVEPSARFEIKQNIDDWLSDDENWDFPITNLRESPQAIETTGTKLSLPVLALEVGEKFRQAVFQEKLAADIRVRQQEPMQCGLEISLNGAAIVSNAWTLRSGEGIGAAYRRYEDSIGSSRLDTRLYVGVADSNRQQAGWYIFCNGRCILEADQESTTGWSEATEGGVNVPKYHGQFARFRGYAFLDAEDASILPWNTTKTSLDPESAAYRRLKPRLIEATRPVINFLNALDGETELEKKDRKLHQALDKAKAVPLANLPPQDTFVFEAPVERGPSRTRIMFYKPKPDADRLMEVFEVDKPNDLGARAFDFAYENLVEDD